MFSETMILQAGRLIICLLVTYVSHSQADFQFSVDLTEDDLYCGHLQCFANYSETDTRVMSITQLAVYDVTQVDVKVKLASMSVYDPTPCVEPIKVSVLNVTGNVSRYHGHLNVGLRDVTDCLYRAFSCDLDFVNVDGQPDVIRETLTPGNVGSCPVLGSQLGKMAYQIKAHLDGFEAELARLKHLESMLGQISRLETRSHDTLQVTCRRGMSNTHPREKFWLWRTVAALCDTETDGGGWVIIQRRTKGDVDFYRDWDTYKQGFGTPDTDFWIGNDNIHNLTSQGYTELRIDMANHNGQLYAHYSSFSVEDEAAAYRMSVSGYTGSDADSLGYSSSAYFSTFDRDNVGYGFPTTYHGAWWWYASNYFNNLNGQWGVTDDTGIVWYTNAGFVNLISTEIKVRRT